MRSKTVFTPIFFLILLFFETGCDNNTVNHEKLKQETKEFNSIVNAPTTLGEEKVAKEPAAAPGEKPQLSSAQNFDSKLRKSKHPDQGKLKSTKHNYNPQETPEKTDQLTLEENSVTSDKEQKSNVEGENNPNTPTIIQSENEKTLQKEITHKANERVQDFRNKKGKKERIKSERRVKIGSRKNKMIENANEQEEK